ncbi:MAG: hypothetical protein HY555_05025, partial [Euryarchaeota archaeon]|nr:hypothetical protein [Euryarchaeota archaeon]
MALRMIPPEIVEDCRAKAEAPTPSPPKEAEDVPDELPPLDAPVSDKPESSEQGTLDDLDKEKEPIPDAIKKAKMAKSKAPDADAKLELPKPMPKEDTPRERIEAGTEPGFFSSILE